VGRSRADIREARFAPGTTMVDIVDSPTRSRMMAAIPGKNTAPEMLVRQLLTREGVRYRLHRRDLPGAPDIVVPSARAALFVHGCFWHVHENCHHAKWPATRSDFWRKKLSGNVDRDADATAMLNMLGWRVLIIWECATRQRSRTVLLGDALFAWLRSRQPYGEIGASTLTGRGPCA
jgi:DNA mismatch endonuclease, patch repair protein